MKKIIICIIVWSVIAAFFYASIWTHTEGSLSECFALTGFIAIAQLVLTVMSYCSLKSLDD